MAILLGHDYGHHHGHGGSGHDYHDRSHGHGTGVQDRIIMDLVMLQNISEVLEESTPREIDAARLEKDICEMEKMVAIHELHI
ncbi:hypothetical protein V6N13_073842 [Hibiscus sabdariffa]